VPRHFSVEAIHRRSQILSLPSGKGADLQYGILLNLGYVLAYPPLGKTPIRAGPLAFGFSLTVLGPSGALFFFFM
jgi:hypothetical protein